MKILLIGATGFIGRHLSNFLNHRGHEVIGTSVSNKEFQQLNVTDYNMCQGILEKGNFDSVINLAGKGATPGSASDSDMVDVNFIGVRNLSRALLRSSGNAPFFLHVASSTEPIPGSAAESEYSVSKARGTTVVRQILDNSDVTYAIARVHNTYGAQQPRKRYIASLLSQFRNGQPLEIGYPDRVRDFCYVDDVIENLTAMVEKREPSNDVEIGTGRGLSLVTVANIVCDTVGAPRSLIRLRTPTQEDAHPMAIANSGLPGFLLCSRMLEDGIASTLKELI